MGQIFKYNLYLIDKTTVFVIGKHRKNINEYYGEILNYSVISGEYYEGN
jgi:hypothetical protein